MLQREQIYTLDDISKIFIGEDKNGGLFDDWLDYRLGLNGNEPNNISFKEWYNQNITPQLLENTSKEIENIKYLFLRFDIQDGERTHQHKVLIQTKAFDIKFAIRKYLLTYRGEGYYDRYYKRYIFWSVEISLKFITYEVLTKQEYDFLFKFLI